MTDGWIGRIRVNIGRTGTKKVTDGQTGINKVTDRRIEELK